MRRLLQNLTWISSGIVIGILAASLSLPALALSDVGMLPIVAVHTSPSTDPSWPALNVVDYDPASTWQSQPGVDSAWVSLEFNSDYRVDYLRIYSPGDVFGDVTIKYEADGVWRPLTGGAHLMLPHGGGWQEFDLSYDGAVTDKLQILISKTNADLYLGGIGQVEVYGSEPLINASRLISSVTASESNLGLPPSYLVDGNTYTTWETKSDAPLSAWVDFIIPESTQITVLKVFGPSSDDDISWQYWSDDAWQYFPSGPVTVSEEVAERAWSRYDVAGAGVTTKRIRMNIENPSRAEKIGGFGEVEIWGVPRQQAGTRETYWSTTGPQELNSSVPESSLVFMLPANLSRFSSATLIFDGWDIDANEFGVRVNGVTVEDTVKQSFDKTWSAQKMAITLPLLEAGLNTISLTLSADSDGLVVDNGRLELLAREGSVLPLGMGVESDRLVTTSWTSLTDAEGMAVLETGLGGLCQLEEIALYIGDYSDQLIDLQFHDGEQWVPIPGLIGLTASNLALNWNVFATPGNPVTDRLRLVFSSRPEATVGNIGEVRVKASPINTGAPKIVITAPRNEDFIEDPVEVSGTVDNCEAEVKVNGFAAEVADGRFSALVDLDNGGLKDGEKIIAVATDSVGQQGSDEITVYSYKRPPKFISLTPSDGIVVTLPSIEVSGELDDNAAEVTINGKPARLTGRKFSAPVELQEDINRITVRASDYFGDAEASVSQTITVIRDTTPPRLSLHTPADGEVVGWEIPVVVGQVDDVSPVTVKVNGQDATIKNGIFQATGIMLAEGVNTIEVVAVDAAGNSAALQAAVTLDTMAPVLVVNSPIPAQLFNYEPIQVTGSVQDETPTAVMVNGIAALRMGSEFVARVPLYEGTNTVITKAVDAGRNESSDVRQVALDTTPPEPFSPQANPASWASVKSPVISFTTLDVTSGLDYFELAVDGGGWVRVESPYTIPAQEDGVHTVTVRAVDKAGWSREASVKVYVDSAPPEAFTPIANPATWTSNNQPVITFGTTDATSGVDHYELKVDDGEYAVAESPHTLEPQADGIHTVTVKAVDKAGLETVETTQIFIDTTPPAIPSGLEVIAGPSSIMVNWQANTESDFAYYVLRRTPAFSDGTSTRIIPKDSEATYLDEDVIVPNEYAYELKAVDHIENSSEFSSRIIGHAGLTITPVNAETGGEVKYEDLEVVLPPAALEGNQFVTILSIEPEDVPPTEGNVIVGKVFNLEVIDNPDEVANPVETVFTHPVTMTFTYQQENIPDGFTEANLYVYTYNLGTQSWVRVPGQIVDIENNTISVPVDHFSTYSIQASAAMPPDPEILTGLGVTPYQSYFTENNESVSPTSGNLTIKAVDMLLPGRNGLDLEIARTYDLLSYQIDVLDAKCQSAVNTGGDTQNVNHAIKLSAGWAIDLPWIGKNDNGQFLTLPGGGTYDIKWKMDGTGWGGQGHATFTYHEGTHFVLEQVQRFVRDSYFLWVIKIGEVWKPDYYILHTKDGRQYRFDDSGKPVSLTDRTGQNKITYNWTDSKLTSITDSVGRVVEFTYSGSKLISIKSGEREVKYGYADGFKVTDPEGRVTSYAYTLMESYYDDHMNPRQVFYTPLLQKITYPSQGYTEYSYEEKKNGFGSGFTRALVSKKVQYPEPDSSQKFNETSFSYSWDDKKIKAATLVTPVQDTQMNFNDDSLTTKKVTKDRTQGSFMVEQVDYQYNKALKAVTKETYTRGGVDPENQQYHSGSAFYKTYAYDNWGNITEQYDSATGLRSYYAYANTNSKQSFAAPFAAAPFTSSVSAKVYDLVTGVAKDNHDPVRDIESPVQTHYQYDAVGNLVKEAKRHEGGWLDTAYEYDQYGNMVKKTDPLGRVSRYEYGSAYNYAYPTKTINQGLKDADGQALADVVTEKGYYFATGLTAWEKNGRAFVTSYEYDKLGRLTKTVYPGAGSPTKLTNYDDLNNTYTITDENQNRTTFFYDGLAHLIKVVQYQKTGGSYNPYATTNFAYDLVGNVSTMIDANGKRTTYLYDGLGRLRRTTFADSNSRQIFYDDYGRTITTLDENGHKKMQQKDWADRVVQVRKYNDYADEVLTTSITYDQLGNQIKVVDPRGDVTRQVYDDLSQVIEIIYPATAMVKPGATTESTINPKVSYAYDAMGNKISETSANGHASGELSKYTTTYQYDALNRLIKTVEPFTTLDGSSNYRITKTYYDPAGNKVKVVDSNGNASTFEYDARNRLTSQTDSLGNTTSYEYDLAGNRVKTTDPRGYSTWYVYDDLNRVLHGILPDETPPLNPYLDAGDNPYVEFTYDLVGNKLTERDPNGNISTFSYTSRYWLDIVTDAAGGKTDFDYDKAGNQTSVTDANGNMSHSFYDDLNRLVRTVNPYAQATSFDYDKAGNLVWQKDTNDHVTEWEYNPFKKLVKVTDAKNGITRYQYDANGNMVAQIDARGQKTSYEYNELNWLMKETNSLGLSTVYDYDPTGKQIKAISPRGVERDYTYYPNSLLKEVAYTLGAEQEKISYEYDAAGNRTKMVDPSGEAVYGYDPLAQVTSLNKSILGRAYSTQYGYDKAGNVTVIKYPGATEWLEYEYNNRNRIAAIAGLANEFSYDAAGNLSQVRLNSGVASTYTPDKMNRVGQIQVTSPAGLDPVLSLNYTRDGEGNILTRNENTYRYDELDRLVNAQVKGTFLDDISSRAGYVTGDFTGSKALNFSLDQSSLASFDYAAASVGLDVSSRSGRIRSLYLAKDDLAADTSRITPNTFDLYASADGTTFDRIDPTAYELQNTVDGRMSIMFTEPLETEQLKVHSKFDERDEDGSFVDKAVFRNILGQLIGAQQEVYEASLTYAYDAVGNRIYESTTKALIHTKEYRYYANSNWLLTDGTYAFVYDDDGNLIKKGNTFVLDGEEVVFATGGRGVDYWEYGYNLRNQLREVKKNGQIVASYTYDGQGLRVSATTTITSKITGESKTTTRDYVFDLADRVIYDKVITTTGELPIDEDPEASTENAYIFAGMAHFAKVEGVIGTALEVYYYHNDHLGSPMAVTDSNGNLAWSQDYLPYGQALNEEAVSTKTRFTFTGKEYDAASGLYYYNARWYDADLGRFISEDTYAGDPNDSRSLNRYAYTHGNPLQYSDPTGHYIEGPEGRILPSYPSHSNSNSNENSSGNDSGNDGGESRPPEAEIPDKTVPAQPEDLNKYEFVSPDQLMELGFTNVTGDMVEALNDTLRKYQINTPEKIAHFLSQVMKESDLGTGLLERYNGTPEEYFQMYEPGTDKGKNLGNTMAGDGLKFRGSGFIHLSGRYNYQRFADYIGDENLMNLEDPAAYVAENYAWEAAGFWWKDNRLNNRIDDLINHGNSGREVSRRVSIRVNGYPSEVEIEKRAEFYERTIEIIM